MTKKNAFIILFIYFPPLVVFVFDERVVIYIYFPTKLPSCDNQVNLISFMKFENQESTSFNETKDPKMKL